MARTLAIFHSAGISGPLRTLLPRLRALADGGEGRVLFPGGGPGFELAAAELPCTVAAYGPAVLPRSPGGALALPLRGARELRALRSAMREAEPEVVVVATAYLPQALAAARLEGVPAVLYAAELLPGRRRLLRRAARLADAVIACSEPVARQYAAARRVEVVPPGIAPLDDDAAAELPGAAPRLAVVGALSPGRGQDVALAALPLVRESFPAASLLVAGEPHPRRGDERFADELRRTAPDGAVFLGAVREIGPVLAGADVVLVPNREDEGFGRVAFEAMAAGTPVVATPLTAAARLLEHGGAGCLLVVPPDQPAALAEAAVTLLRDPELAGRLAVRARRWVAENLAEEELTPRFVEVVRAVTRPG